MPAQWRRCNQSMYIFYIHTYIHIYGIYSVNRKLVEDLVRQRCIKPTKNASRMLFCHCSVSYTVLIENNYRMYSFQINIVFDIKCMSFLWKAAVMAKQRINFAVTICAFSLCCLRYQTCVSCVSSKIATNLSYCTPQLQRLIVALHSPFPMGPSPWLMVAPLLIALWSMNVKWDFSW